MKKKGLFVAVLLALAALPSGAGAVVVDLHPSKDTTIFSEAFGQSNCSGGAHGLFVGKNSGGGIRRSLIKFNLSSLPAGPLIQSVDLKLTLGMVAGMGAGGGEQTISLSPLSADWGEGSAAANAANDNLAGTGSGAAAQAGDASGWRGISAQIRGRPRGATLAPPARRCQSISRSYTPGCRRQHW